MGGYDSYEKNTNFNSRYQILGSTILNKGQVGLALICPLPKFTKGENIDYVCQMSIIRNIPCSTAFCI